MSELHTYRITYHVATVGPEELERMLRGIAPSRPGAVPVVEDIEAFNAADAAEQWRGRHSEAVRRLVKIEPLPDAPTRGPEIGELVAALEWCGGSSDFGEGGRARGGWARVVQPLLDRFHGKPAVPCEAATPPRREWATIPVAGVNLTPLEGTARAGTPGDRADALETALRERTAERDEAVRKCGIVRDERAQAACELATMRSERDALIDAIDGKPGTFASPAACAKAWDTRAWLKRLEEAAGKWRDTLNEIAAIVWPAAGKEYALADLVKCVRNTADSLRGAVAERDEAQARRDRLYAALAEIAAVVWPNVGPRDYTFDPAQLVEAVRKMGAERDALKADNAELGRVLGVSQKQTEEARQGVVKLDGMLAKAEARTNEAESRVETLRHERDALQRMNEAGSSEVVAEMAKTREMKSERDALQKRIDAALEYRSAWTAPTPVDAIKVMVAILEGREP